MKSWPENDEFSCVCGRTRKMRKHFFAEGFAEAHVFRNSGYQQSLKPFRTSRSRNSAKKPSRKQPRKAEAKNTTSATRGRASRKG